MAWWDDLELPGATTTKTACRTGLRSGHGSITESSPRKSRRSTLTSGAFRTTRSTVVMTYSRSVMTSSLPR